MTTYEPLNKNRTNSGKNTNAGEVTLSRNFPITRESFETAELFPTVTKWYKLNANQKEANKHLSRLLVICNTLRVYPEDLSKGEPVEMLKQTMLKFKEVVDAGNIQYTHQNKVSVIPQSLLEYETGLKNFLSTEQYMPPTAKVFRNPKPNQYLIFLNDDEITKVFHILSQQKDRRFVIMATIQHEIFARIEALHAWTVDNIVLKNDTIDGITYQYAEVKRFYEPKQHEYYDKIILDPRVLKIIKKLHEIQKGEPIVAKTDRREWNINFNKVLRNIYTQLGKTNDVDGMVKSKDAWYWWNRPTHALRKSGSAQALRRCGYDYSNVASMGWASDDLLRKTYAQPKVLLEKSCEYCKPPEHKQDNESFCSFAHYLAFQYNQRKSKKPTEDVEYLKARIRELEAKSNN